jgi:RimJ/RimL family protein N-acetyltransferase
MSFPSEIRTERLLLRPWKDEDRDAFAAMNADPQVCEYFRGVLSREESDAFVDRIQAHFLEHGFGFWALEIPDVSPLAGLTGMAFAKFDAHFTPCVEIGWRLATPYWGKGYATEAASAALDYGFNELALDEIVAFTAVGNERSRRVMERLGMTRNPDDDFDHPSVPEDHPVRRHVLYRVSRESWST